MRLKPSPQTHAPPIPRFQARKLILGTRRHQVIAHRFPIDQKILSHHRANRMHSLILLRGMATAIAKKPRQGLQRASLQFRCQHIFCHTPLNLRFHDSQKISRKTFPIKPSDLHPKCQVDRGHSPPSSAVPVISGLGQASLDACHCHREILGPAKHGEPCLGLNPRSEVE